MASHLRGAGGRYEILVEGILGEQWSDWLGGMAIAPGEEGQTCISGAVPDQSALFGILAQLHALNVTLVAVRRLPDPAEDG